MSAKRQPDQTRQNLLDAAFAEIHRNGFRSASLDRILSDAGVTKGALYHHFGSKADLGYAVVDEMVRPHVFDGWELVTAADNVLDGALALMGKRMVERGEMALDLGCPFNNLVQEMSPVDEGFRERLRGILEDWRTSMAMELRRGQMRGHVRDDIDVEATAAFIISGLEGCIGMAKGSQSEAFLKLGMQGLQAFLDNLRKRS